MPEAKMSRMELVQMIREIIADHSNDPAEEMITLGKAMTEIGKALKGQSPAESRAIMKAVMALEAV